MKTLAPHTFIKGKTFAMTLFMVLVFHFLWIFWVYASQLNSKVVQTPPNILRIELLKSLEIAKQTSPSQTLRSPITDNSKLRQPNTPSTIVSHQAAGIATQNVVSPAPIKPELSPSPNKEISVSSRSPEPIPTTATHLTSTSISATQASPSKTNEGVTRSPVLLPSSSQVNNNASSSHTSNNLITRDSNSNPGSAVTSLEKPNALASHLNNPKPIYPKRSRELGEQGVVVLSIWVEADGKPSKVQIIKSSGFPRLDDSAQRQISENWRFVPGQRNGQKEAMELIQRIPFSLTEASP